MGLTIRDAESSFLSGRARFEAWKERFEGGWYGPVGESLVRLMWARLPVEAHARLAQADPAGHERLAQKLGGRYGKDAVQAGQGGGEVVGEQDSTTDRDAGSTW